VGISHLQSFSSLTSSVL